MDKEEITYTAAFEELKAIVDQLENDSVSVDELTEKMKRATVLMKICRDRFSSVLWRVSSFRSARPH